MGTPLEKSLISIGDTLEEDAQESDSKRVSECRAQDSLASLECIIIRLNQIEELKTLSGNVSLSGDGAKSTLSFRGGR